MSAAGIDLGTSPYHRHVDGLRALAVLAIVIFHAAPSLLPGGFIGVDVFFVISGFLITGIILREREEERFSFARFYLRRARRILPAYIVVTAFVAAFAYWLLLPDELQNFGWALGSAGLFLTNFVFAGSSGYFDPIAEQSPLLHLWSLAVEEQFYLVWPLLIGLLSIARLKRVRPWIAVALLGLSLAGAQALVSSGGAKLAFFHLPFRAWEFMLGGLLVIARIPAPRRGIAEGATLAGLTLIFASAALLSPATPFPGPAAAPACLGAALVIWAGGDAHAAAPLRTAPVVGVGLISYSLYLWHWPLLVFARIIANAPLTLPQALLVVLGSLVLAFLTWSFVESPWRRQAPPPQLKHLGYAAAPLAVILLLGLAPLNLGGLPQRMPDRVLQAAALERSDVNPDRKTCFLQSNKLRHTASACRPAGPVHVIMWGDSHADALTPGVRAWAEREGLNFQQSAASGCPPLVGVRLSLLNGVSNPSCHPFNDSVLGEIAAAKDLKLIVLAARWPMHAQAEPVYDINSGRTRLADLRTGRPITVEHALDRTLAAIAATGSKARVLVIGAVPELPQIVPRCVARMRLMGLSEEDCFSADARLPLLREAQVKDDIERALARHPRAVGFRPAEWLCREGRCEAGFEGRPIYFDDDHLAASAATRLVPQWIDKALAVEALVVAADQVPQPAEH